MALLEVDDLHTYYGNIHALKGVSLTVDEGEIVDAHRRQRRRQDDDPQHDQRAPQAARGPRSVSTGRT